MAFARNRGTGPAKGTLEYFEAQSRTGRIFWILSLFLSVINVVSLLTSSNLEEVSVYLLSSYIPLDFFMGAKLLTGEFGSSAVTTVLYAIAAVYMVVGILTAIFWKKHPAWPIIATVLYAVDCIYFFSSYGFSDIKLALGHAAVMLLVAVGAYFALKANKARKAAAENPVPTAEPVNNNYTGPEL
ncbi:MAG: hypothetical protein E7459_04070 [Ruminococcaceae bacterium]|nr:hypothetical protein [Oscillospiraceae bacterium]